MAKVKLSALVSDMRGKLNGSVFARNRGGLYLRTKVTPANPQTGAQQLARNILGGLSQAWKALSVAQRLSWNNAVANFQTTDVFGDIKSPSGLNLYVRLNSNIQNVDKTPIAVAPQPVGAPATPVFSIIANGTAQAFDITSSVATVPADMAMVVESTVGVSAGKSNVNSLFRKIAVLADGDNITASILADQQAKFGSVVTGQRYSVRLKFVNTLTGETSVVSSATTIAV